MPSSNAFGPTLNIVTWILSPLALILVLLRLYVRFKERRNAGWDDYLIALAGVLHLTTAIMLSVAISTGTGKHMDQIDPTQLPTAAHINLAADSLLIFDVTLPKLSVAVLLVRLLNPKRVVEIVLIALVLLGIILAGVVVAVTFEQCTPVAGQWDPIRHPAKCWKPSILVGVSFDGGVYAAFLDFVFAVYPLSVFWQLQMSLKKRIDISVLMGLGLGAGAIATYKCTLLPLLGQRKDLLYTSASVLMWTDIEASAVIMAACIPTLKPYGKIARSATKSLRELVSRETYPKAYDRFSGDESADQIELVPQDHSITRKTEFSVEAENRGTSRNSHKSDYRQYGVTGV